MTADSNEILGHWKEAGDGEEACCMHTVRENDRKKRRFKERG